MNYNFFMKLKIIYLILGSLLYGVNLFAQNGRYEFSARNAAMAGASATVGDAYSGFHNVAGLAQYTEGVVATVGYQNRYGLSELSSLGFGVTIPVAIGTMSLLANRFGTEEYYNEQRLGVGFANKIGFVNLGASVSYVQYSIETVGTRHMASIDFGGLVEITQKLHFGSYIRNINQAKIQDFTDERLPTLLVMGLSWRPLDNLMLNSEIERDLDFGEVVKLGVEYRATETLDIRTGIRTAPFQGTFGLGFSFGKFKADYAYISETILGDIHEFSLLYLLKSK